MTPKQILALIAGGLAILALVGILNPFGLPVAVLLLAICIFL